MLHFFGNGESLTKEITKEILERKILFAVRYL